MDAENREIDKTTTTTTAWGESATRSREVEGQGGYATIEGSASTSTGRAASGEAVAGRNRYGQPAVAGTVNTKYNGTYNAAAARTPHGGWNTAVAGPYGGRVTTTLPSGYRTTTYYGRPYYSYGGAYYRPYTHGGVHYYYPVPPPYYSYYSYPPPGATILMIAGVKYLMSQDGSYSKQTTTSDGKTAYQSVPAPQGATIATLPATRVLVTVAGTTYYLNANAFYRRVMNGAQESFVTVTAPAGVVFVAALPANFEVVQLNTMYFMAGGRYYVPYLAPDGGEKYVMVDTPPTPPSAAAAPAPAKAPAPAAPPAAKAPASAPGATPAPPAAAPVRAVVEHLEAPAGTVLVVRLATDVSSATAQVGNRFQGFLDQDLAANGRMIAPHGGEGVRGRQRSGCGQQDEGPPDVERDAHRPAGGRPRDADQDPTSERLGRHREWCEEAGRRSGTRRHHRCHRRRWRGRRDRCGGGRRGRWSGGRGQLRQTSRHRGADPAGLHPGRAAAGGDHDERGRPLKQERNMMKRHSRLMWIACALALIAARPAAQDLQQKLAAAKQAAALNQQALRSYSWLEKTELSLKGEVKNTKVDMCRYGPDGKVQKTPVVEPAPPQKQRGLKGKIVAKKTGEMKEELEAAVALVQQYLPPSPDMMQVVMNAGTASISQAGPGRASLKFPGYAKANDALTLTFDTAVKALQQIAVQTWLDEPDNAVTLNVTMAALPDGTSHPGTVVLGIPKRHIEVRITKSNYQKLAQ